LSERGAVNPEVVYSISAKTQKFLTENSNLHRIELNRPSHKSNNMQIQVSQAIINQLNLYSYVYTYIYIYIYAQTYAYCIYTVVYINIHICTFVSPWQGGCTHT